MARKGLTLLPGLVRRPQHLPLGRQLRSPECSTNDSLSNYRIARLFRTRQVSLPDYWRRPNRAHRAGIFSTILHIGITQLTLYTAITFVIHQFPGLYCYFRAPIQINFITYSKHVCSCQENRPDWITPPCHHKRPPPVRRQSPTTTTRGC